MKKLIKFEKNDCNPCAMVSEFLDKKGVSYERVNAFDNPEMAMKYRVRTVPTVVLVDGETEIKRSMGFKVEELNELLAEAEQN